MNDVIQRAKLIIEKKPDVLFLVRKLSNICLLEDSCVQSLRLVVLLYILVCLLGCWYSFMSPALKIGSEQSCIPRWRLVLYFPVCFSGCYNCRF